MLVVILVSFEAEGSRLGELAASLAILLECDDSHEDFVLKKVAMQVALESYEEFECAVLG